MRIWYFLAVILILIGVGTVWRAAHLAEDRRSVTPADPPASATVTVTAPASATAAQTEPGILSPSATAVPKGEDPIVVVEADQDRAAVGPYDLILGSSAVEEGSLPGLPFLRRWRPVSLPEDLGSRLGGLRAGDEVRFAAFADAAWVCRVRQVRLQQGSLVVNAVPVTEPASTLLLEIRGPRVVMRLDRGPDAPRYLLGRHTASQDWVVAEIDHAAEVAARLGAGDLGDLHVCGNGNCGHDHGHPQDAPVDAQIGGDGFTLADLPDGDFARAVRGLGKDAQARVIAELRRNPVPRVDLAELRVQASGDLFYVCRIIPVAAAAVPESTEDMDPPIIFAMSATIPAYHSRPSQTTNILYIDCDGHVIPENTLWKTEFGYSGISGKTAKAFDIDGDSSTFSDDELTYVQMWFNTVAEMYAPFEIDVTTEEPATWTTSTARCLVTEWKAQGGTTLPHNGAGGVAYVNVWGKSSFDEDDPSATNLSFVLPYTGSLAKYTAQAIAHEVGHNLGLSHDGKGGSAYYSGHSTAAGTWGPIMGGGAAVRIAQWSQGDYDGATNTQDDLDKIANKIGSITDAVGDDETTATLLSDSGTSLTVSGLIDTTDDADVYALTMGAGIYSISAVPALEDVDEGVGGSTYSYDAPTLDIRLTLVDESGAVVAEDVNESDLEAALSGVSGTGQYYLWVRPDEVGTLASPLNGYSTYGCLGNYSIEITRVVHGGPEIRIVGNGRTIRDGDTTPSVDDDTDFGSSGVGVGVAQVFTVQNRGSSTLTLGGTPKVALSGSSDFSVTVQPGGTVSSGASTTFTITYTPSDVGDDTATVSIASNDGDENPTTFVIQGSTSTSLAYSAYTYDEASVNDGSIDNASPITVTLTGDSFTGSDGDDLIADGKITVTNLPAGLTLVATRTSSTTLVLTVDGNATVHDATDSITDLGVTFENSAFPTGNASGHSGYQKLDIAITYRGILVTTGDDEAVGASAAADLADGTGMSLREALAWVAAGDIITFTDSVSTITLGLGELLIVDSVDIDGDDRITIDAQDLSRHADIDDGDGGVDDKDVFITGVTFINGFNEAVDDNAYGGSIAARENLVLTRCTFSDNTCIGDASTTSTHDGRGGAIYLTGGNLTLEQCAFIDNAVRANDDVGRLGHALGGAVYASTSGTMTVSRCAFSGNTAIGNAGSNFGRGGAIYISSFDLTVEQSTFSGNQASTEGGAIYDRLSALTLENCTVVDNETGHNANDGGAITLSSADIFSLISTIVARNSAYTGITFNGAGVAGYDIAGFPSTDPVFTNTLWDSTTCVLSRTPIETDCIDLLGGDPGLGTLADNGGAVETVALLGGSPAIDAGTNPNTYTTDIRGSGFARVVGSAIDIGAHENQAPEITSNDPILGVVMSEDGDPVAWSAPGFLASDPDTSTLATEMTWTVSAAPAHGSAAFGDASDPATLVYTPTAEYAGEDAFTIQLSDGNLTDTYTVQVAITLVHDAPVINQTGPLAVTMSEDGSPTAWAAPTLSATDPDTTPLTWSVSAAPANGSAVFADVNDPATLVFTPTANWHGSTTFTIQVSDGTGSDSIVVNVTVDPVADPPVIAEGASVGVTLSEDGTPTAFALTLNASDGDGDTLTWSISSQGSLGTASVSGTGTSKAIAYVPSANLNGSDSFVVQVSDGTLTDSITVNVTIDAVNDFPTVAGGSPVAVGMSEDGDPTAFSLSLTASDVELSTLTWSISAAAANGTATVSGTTASGVAKAISYAPNADWNGADSFTVQVSDGTNTTNVEVNVTVSAVNDTPTVTVAPAVSGSHLVGQTLSGTGGTWTDVETDIITSTLVWQRADDAVGTGATDVASGTSTYLLGTADAHRYVRLVDRIVDDGSPAASAEAATAWTLVGNTTPAFSISGPVAVTMSEDGAPTAFSLTLNASDADGDTLTWDISAAAGSGTASASGTGTSKVITYVPDADVNGSDSFTVRIDDGATTATITVNLTIDPVNDPPELDNAPTYPTTAQVGVSSSISGGAWNDDRDGGMGITLTYRWELADDAIGTNASTIALSSGATSYAPVAADFGKWLRVTQIATDAGNPGSESAEASSTWIEITQAAPVVSAGTDQLITLPATASLDGTVSDDGAPVAPGLTTTWTQVSGPGTVTFGDASLVDTTASFSTWGVYVLRLTADDGALSTSDDVQVTVYGADANGADPVLTATTITLSGSVSTDVTAVTVDGTPATMSGTTWSITLPMPTLSTTYATEATSSNGTTTSRDIVVTPTPTFGG